MSIQSNFPNLQPSLLLDFANTKQLDNRVTFTRSTPAVYYDGKTTAMAEQNLLLQSQTFNSASWTQDNATLTGSQTAPDGTSTAWLITDNSTNSDHRIYQIDFPSSSGAYTIFSVYLKNGTRQYALIRLQKSLDTAGIIVDLSAGTIASTGGNAYFSSSITSVGNGWYRCVIVGSGLLNGNVVVALSNTASYGANIQYVGSGQTIYAWGAQAEVRNTPSATAYTPTTTQAITNYIPVLLSAGGNQARFDHNPTTGESLGLLIEEQRTNNALNSQNFNNWTKYNCTVNNAAIISPSGSLDGNKLISSATTNGQTIEASNATFVSGSIYTLSVYAKAGEYRYIQMSLPSFVTTQYVNADLVSGTINGGSYISASITSVGNGWYRISFSFTSSYSGATVAASISLQTTVNPARGTSITGDGFSGFYIWGAQQELGAFASSYIATTSASATRTADDASMTGTNFSSWYNQGEGSIVASYYINVTSGNRYVVSLDKDSNNYVEIAGNTPSNNTILYNRSFGTLDVSITGSSNVSLVSRNILASTVKTNDFALCLNGTMQGTDTNAILSSNLASLEIGRYNEGSAGGYFNGRISKIAYYPIRLSNTNLQALTS